MTAETRLMNEKPKQREICTRILDSQLLHNFYFCVKNSAVFQNDVLKLPNSSDPFKTDEQLKDKKYFTI